MMTKEAIELPGPDTGTQSHLGASGEVVSQPAWSTMAVVVDGPLKVSLEAEEKERCVDTAFRQKRKLPKNRKDQKVKDDGLGQNRRERLMTR